MLSSPRRSPTRPARRAALLAVAALCVAAPGTAGAATTRYASPTGTGSGPCPQAAPCSIEKALSKVEGLANGDTVLLAPGTYHPAGELDVLPVSVTVAGEPGLAAPVIEVAGERGLFFPNPGRIHDVRIHSTSATLYALSMIGAESVIERVESSGEASRACSFGAVAVRDTLCVATPALGGGEGVEMSSSAATPSLTEATLSNVTAIGGYAGIDVAANQQSSITLKVSNSIVSGGIADVVAASHAPTAPVAVELSHSNFAAIETEGSAVTVTAPGAAGNQTAGPLFVDPEAGDYREWEASPTRLAGDLGAVLPGERDLAGNPRTTTCAGTVGVDIGAYQFDCAPPGNQPVIPVEPVTPTANPSASNQPAVGPRLSKLALRPARFAVTGPRKARKGTTISFELSLAAAVKLEVLAKKTVNGKRRSVPVGALPAVAGRLGPNSVRFAGRLKGRPLAPGRYALRASAAAAGFGSAPVTAGFEVLIP